MLQPSEQRLLANCWERIQGDQRAAASPGDLLLLTAAGSHCCFITVCPWPRDPPGLHLHLGEDPSIIAGGAEPLPR